jgi:hypothetical protein
MMRGYRHLWGKSIEARAFFANLGWAVGLQCHAELQPGMSIGSLEKIVASGLAATGP